MILFCAILFIILQILDISTTVFVISRGGRELNPLIKNMMDRLGVIPALIVIKIPLIAIVIFFIGSPYSWAIPFMTVGYLGLIGWNGYQVWKSIR